ncbi:MAG: hypothetical protein K9K93_00880 [Acholeplasmataceae bacterium]|nr:hypothetical protein [Acholeplasmataceae bacterium]
MNHIRKCFLSLSLMTCLFVLVCCLKLTDSQEIKGVAVNPETLMASYEPGAFDISTLELVVTMDDGKAMTLWVTESMVDESDLENLLIQGTHTITITYQGFETEVDITIEPSALNSILLSIYQLGIQENVIDMTYEAWLESIKGEDGQNGVGIASMIINPAGELVVTLTDGQDLNLGQVQGRDGQDGHNGEEGTDGTSIINIVINDQGSFVFEFSDGTFLTTDVPPEPQEMADGVVAVIEGNTIGFRAREFSEVSYDLMTKATIASPTTSLFNYGTIGKIPTSAPLDELSITALKSSGDDSCPANFNSSYVAGNHAPSWGQSFKATAHGKTEADIGLIWHGTSNPDVDYVLWRVVDPNTLWFAPMTEDFLISGKPFRGKALQASEVLTHVRGATHLDDITVTSIINNAQQLHPANNHITKRLIVEGKEVPLDMDGVYHGESIDLIETYDIVYTPAALSYLIANVGFNTNDSAGDDGITEAYMSVSITHRFHKNGAVVEYISYDIRKAIDVGYFGLVQSSDFVGDDHYIYVPNSIYDDIHWHAPGTSIDLGSATWRDPSHPPTSFFQLNSSDPTYAMNLGYCPDFGTARADRRLSKLTSAGFFYSSYKMYPRLINGGTLSDGDRIEAVAYRILSAQIDPDFTVVNWYWVNDDIYLMVAAHKTVDTYLELPLEMDGLMVSVVEISDETMTPAEIITASRIRIKMTGSSNYMILRLSTR